MSRSHAWAWGIAAVVAAGCGSVSKGAGGTGGGVGSDAGTDVGGDVDRDVHADSGGDAPLPGDAGGSDAARVCDITRAFGTPVLLAGVNSDSTTVVNDDMARLSPDELTIYFTSDRPGGTGSNNDIYTATRTSRSAPFGAPLPLGGINTPAASEAWPTLTSDGLTLFFESTTSGSYQVLVATRTTLVAQFSAAVPVANLNAGPIDGQPFVLPDESALYFASSRTGTNGGLDLYRAARGGGGAFGTPAQLATVNTPSQEYAPTPTANELTLYFSSDRTDAPSKGDHDIWVSQRTSTSAAFSPPVNVQELNTAATEWPDWLSPDNCRLYFTRRETTGRKIYVAERAM
jgi:Tol biopolymer transport system component